MAGATSGSPAVGLRMSLEVSTARRELRLKTRNPLKFAAAILALVGLDCEALIPLQAFRVVSRA